MAERRIIPPGIRDAVAVAYADLLGRYDAMDRSAVIPLLVDRVTATAIPVLLEQFHVDFCRPDATETQRRQLVKRSIPWHRVKGTPGALRELVEYWYGITPTIRERTYFLLGSSRLGQEGLGVAPSTPFCLGLAKAGARLSLPRPGKFHFDVIIAHADAVAASVVRADVAAMATAMMPARSRATVRFRGFRLGDATYSQLGRDLLA
jgi:hypothetical protein